MNDKNKNKNYFFKIEKKEWYNLSNKKNDTSQCKPIKSIISIMKIVQPHKKQMKKRLRSSIPNQFNVKV